ncbi:uncharacterized protein LOC122402253 [Colletes gigas]|uniref:uncharacterized protein LOC122402253 n=1 Tax=Colletes gigas TaxID=935657 RepID=UPI001C9B4F10|nr:uncharacterized protein LOC122402253 [Colletes gigas]
MKEIYLSIFLSLCTVSLVFATIDEDKPYCFHFRWVPPMYDNRPEKYNCTMSKGVPCIEPLISTKLPPNMTELWDMRNETLLCPLTSGNVCIKYVFEYNNNIVNMSFFCGKIMEDQVTAITSGCYQQNVGGYTVEACACESRREPCNASIKTKYSVILMIYN